MLQPHGLFAFAKPLFNLDAQPGDVLDSLGGLRLTFSKKHEFEQICTYGSAAIRVSDKLPTAANRLLHDLYFFQCLSTDT